MQRKEKRFTKFLQAETEDGKVHMLRVEHDWWIRDTRNPDNETRGNPSITSSGGHIAEVVNREEGRLCIPSLNNLVVVVDPVELADILA